MQDFGTVKRFPLSNQQRAILNDCLNADDDRQLRYNNPYLYHLLPDIDMDRFAHSWRMAIDMHGAVKSRFSPDDDGNFAAIVDNDLQPNVKEVSFPASQWEDELRHIVKPFDINADDDLYRVLLINIVDDENEDEVIDKFLFHDFHVIICDESSRIILLSTAEDIYTTGNATREDITAPQIAEREENLSLNEAVAWHDNLLQGVDGISEPISDIADKETLQASGTLALDATAEDFSSFYRQHGIAAAVLTTAAMGLTLAKHLRRHQAVFATIYSGRNCRELNHTVGMLVKTLPMVCRWDLNMSVMEYLRLTKQVLYAARDFSIRAFSDVAAEYNLSDDIIFAYQGRIFPENNTSCLAETVNRLETAPAKPKLIFEVVDRGDDGLQLRCRYHANRYSTDLITQLMSDYDYFLNELLVRRDLSDIDSLDFDKNGVVEIDNDDDDNETIVNASDGNTAQNEPETAETVLEPITEPEHINEAQVAAIDLPRELNFLEKKLVEMVDELTGDDEPAFDVTLENLGFDIVKSSDFAEALAAGFKMNFSPKEIAGLTLFDIENKILKHLLSNV